MPRGVANGRVLLLITTLLVTFGTIAVGVGQRGSIDGQRGSAWSIMIHDLVYLGFGYSRSTSRHVYDSIASYAPRPC